MSAPARRGPARRLASAPLGLVACCGLLSAGCQLLLGFEELTASATGGSGGTATGGFGATGGTAGQGGLGGGAGSGVAGQGGSGGSAGQGGSGGSAGQGGSGGGGFCETAETPTICAGSGGSAGQGGSGGGTAPACSLGESACGGAEWLDVLGDPETQGKQSVYALAAHEGRIWLGGLSEGKARWGTIELDAGQENEKAGDAFFASRVDTPSEEAADRRAQLVPGDKLGQSVGGLVAVDGHLHAAGNHLGVFSVALGPNGSKPPADGTLDFFAGRLALSLDAPAPFTWLGFSLAPTGGAAAPGLQSIFKLAAAQGSLLLAGNFEGGFRYSLDGSESPALAGAGCPDPDPQNRSCGEGYLLSVDPATGASRWMMRARDGAGPASASQVIADAAALEGDIVLAGAFSGHVEIQGKTVCNPAEGFHVFVARTQGAAPGPDGSGPPLRWLRAATHEPQLGSVFSVAAHPGKTVEPGDDSIALSGLLTGPVAFESTDPSGCSLALDHVGGTVHTLYVLSLDGEGRARWARPVATSGAAFLRQVRVAYDQDGDLVVAGWADRTILGASGKLAALPAGSDIDAFVLKLRGADGALVWARHLGGPGVQMIGELTLTPEGKIVVAGTFTAGITLAGDPPLSASTLSGSDQDVFVARLNPDGEMVPP